jgi:hypothetical protein
MPSLKSETLTRTLDPPRWVVDSFYSPPEDGAQAVLYAATVPWDKDRKVIDGTPVLPSEDLRWATHTSHTHTHVPPLLPSEDLRWASHTHTHTHTHTPRNLHR